jgi:hypothetical protein
MQIGREGEEEGGCCLGDKTSSSGGSLNVFREERGWGEGINGKAAEDLGGVVFDCNGDDRADLCDIDEPGDDCVLSSREL